jgi:hypothetical protein
MIEVHGAESSLKTVGRLDGEDIPRLLWQNAEK